MLDLTNPVLIYWDHISHVFHSVTETDQISISSPLLVCLSIISRALSLVLSVVNKSLSFCCLLLHSTKMTGWILPNLKQLELEEEQEAHVNTKFEESCHMNFDALNKGNNSSFKFEIQIKSHRYRWLKLQKWDCWLDCF